MMDDLELLELAAKAAGLPGVGVIHRMDERGTQPNDDWNPLKDAGDCWRLAERLGMYVDFQDGIVYCVSNGVRHADLCLNKGVQRAVVSLAAKIGKGM